MECPHVITEQSKDAVPYCSICAPKYIAFLQAEVRRLEGVNYAISRHSDSLRVRMTEKGIADPIQSAIQKMIHDKTVDFDDAIQIDVYLIARFVLAYLEGEG